MMETIFEWIGDAVNSALSYLIQMFLASIQFSLKQFISVFPVVPESYEIFQAIGIGLVLCIAAWQIFRFFGGQLSDIKETPVVVLIRAAIAAFLIYFGGYVLEYIVDIAKTPYDVIANGLTGEAFTWKGFGQDIVQKFSSSAQPGSTAEGQQTGTKVITEAALLLNTAGCLLLWIVMLAIECWEIIKLAVQVCERFISVCLSVYISPLLFSSVASADTAPICKQWFKTFLGQCILMTISVWMLKLILSCFNYGGDDNTVFFMRWFMAIAMCKVAQRIDGFMQSFGFGMTGTGRMIADEIAGDARTLFGSGNSGKDAANGKTKGAVLGKNLGNGLLGQAFAGATSWAAGIKDGNVVSTAKKAKKDIENAPENIRDKAEADFKKGSADIKDILSGHSNGAPFNQQAGPTEEQDKNDKPFDFERDVLNSPSNFKSGSVEAGANGLNLNQDALNSKLSWDHGTNTISSMATDGEASLYKDETVGSHIANNYQKAMELSNEGLNDDSYQQALINTVEGNSNASDYALMQCDAEMDGNDQLGNAMLHSSFHDGISEDCSGIVNL